MALSERLRRISDWPRKLDRKLLGPPKSFTFSVGQRERHQVMFRRDQVDGYEAVYVDGKLLFSQYLRRYMPWGYKFSVGGPERHTVYLDRCWRGFRVSVDGQDIGGYRLERVTGPY